MKHQSSPLNLQKASISALLPLTLTTHFHIIARTIYYIFQTVQT